MAGGYTYDDGATVVPDFIPDTQPTDTIPTSPCGKVLKTNKLPEPIKEEKV